MDFFAGLVNFFTDKKHSISSKVFGVILIIGIVILVNNLLGFTFYYSINQKINQIEKIEKLKRDTILSPENLIFLNGIEERLKSRENIFDRFISLFRETSFNDPEVQIDNKRGNVETPKSEKKESDSTKSSLKIYDQTAVRSRLWHTVSSTFVFLLIIIIVPFMPFISKNFSKESLLAVIVIFVSMSGLVWLSQYLLGLIPLIMDTPIINYVINASTQLVIGYLLVKLIKNMK